MKKLFFLIAFLLVSLTPVRADDDEMIALSSVPGTPTFVGRTQPDIRLESERVVLTLRADGFCETQGVYSFVNDTPKTVKVRIAFPESSGEALAYGKLEPLGFKSFAATAGGRAIAPVRTPVREGDELFTRWVYTQSFAPRGRVEVRQTVLSRPRSGENFGLRRYLSYRFEGHTWKGNVGRSELEVRVPVAGTWISHGGLYQWPPADSPLFKPQLRSKNGVAYLRQSWRDWEGKAQLQLSLQRVMPGWLIDEEQDGTSIYLDDEEAATLTFGVGQGIGRVDKTAPQGFVADGVTMVSLAYLARIAKNSPLENGVRYDAPTRTATLRVGALSAAFAPANKTMSVAKGSTRDEITLPIAPRLLDVAGERKLYVPLDAATKALGMEYSLDAKSHRITVRLIPVAAPTIAKL